MSFFGGHNRKGNGLNADSLASIKEVSNYSQFLKHYRDDFNSIIGKLNDCPDYASIHSKSSFNVIYPESKEELFYQDPAYENYHSCFSQFSKLYERVDELEKEVYQTVLPQLSFFSDRSYPNTVPSSIKKKLWFYSGKDLTLLQNACEHFESTLSLLCDIYYQFSLCDADPTSPLNLLLQRTQKAQPSGHFLFTLTSSKSSQQSLAYLNAYKPILFLLMRICSLVFTFHTVADSIRPFFEQYHVEVKGLNLPEEGKVISQNWDTLLQYHLFQPLPGLLKLIQIQLSPRLLSVSLNMVEHQLNAYLRFEHCVPLAGIGGLLLLLQNTHSLEDNPQNQRCVRLIHSQCHFESMYGYVNIRECESILQLVGPGDSFVKNARKRLKSKKKYIPRMNELTVLLNSLKAPESSLSPQVLLGFVKEAFGLHQRMILSGFSREGVSMAVEVFAFVKNNSRMEIKPEVWYYLMTLQLTLHRLEQALYQNPSLQRLLPLLMTVHLSNLATELESPVGNSSYVSNHPFNEANLLWLTFTGAEDLAKDKLAERLHTTFVLQHLYHSYQYSYSIMNTAHLLLFNLRDLEQFLQLTVDVTQITALLTTYTTVLNRCDSLLQPLPLPQKDIIQHAFFITFYNALVDYLITTVRKTADNIIRSRVFLSDHLVLEEATTNIKTESSLTLLKAMAKIPPISVMGVSLDLKHLLSLFYSQDHYNILVSSRETFILHDLIASHLSQFYKMELVESSLFPEKITANTENLRNGSGLFGVNYAYLSQYVFVQSEKAILACIGDSFNEGSIPLECELIFVKTPEQMKKYIQRYNRNELLDTMYQTTSCAEHILRQLIDSLNEEAIRSILQQSFASLFENDHFLHASVPLTNILECEKQLTKIDPNLLANFLTLVNHFAVLMALLQIFNQIHHMQDEQMFDAIIQNFNELCWNSVSPASILIFIILLYRHSLMQASYLSPIYADNIAYGVMILLKLFNLTNEYSLMRVFTTFEKQLISFDELTLDP